MILYNCTMTIHFYVAIWIPKHFFLTALLGLLCQYSLPFEWQFCWWTSCSQNFFPPKSIHNCNVPNVLSQCTKTNRVQTFLLFSIQLGKDFIPFPCWLLKFSVLSISASDLTMYSLLLSEFLEFFPVFFFNQILIFTFSCWNTWTWLLETFQCQVLGRTAVVVVYLWTCAILILVQCRISWLYCVYHCLWMCNYKQRDVFACKDTWNWISLQVIWPLLRT